MGFEAHKKPQPVEKAIFSDNVERLRAMGRKGGVEAARRKEQKTDEEQAIKDWEAEKESDAEDTRSQSANEHIISPDGEDRSTPANQE